MFPCFFICFRFLASSFVSFFSTMSPVVRQSRHPYWAGLAGSQSKRIQLSWINLCVCVRCHVLATRNALPRYRWAEACTYIYIYIQYIYINIAYIYIYIYICIFMYIGQPPASEGSGKLWDIILPKVRTLCSRYCPEVSLHTFCKPDQISPTPCRCPTKFVFYFCLG